MECSHHIALSTKLRLYNTCILLIVLYASECWAPTKADVARLDAFDQWCPRHIEVFILGHYDPPSTGRIQQLAYNTNHRQGATKLLKLLNKYSLVTNGDF